MHHTPSVFGTMEVDPSIISAQSTGSARDGPVEPTKPSLNGAELTPQPIFERIPDIPDFSCQCTSPLKAPNRN